MKKFLIISAVFICGICEGREIHSVDSSVSFFYTRWYAGVSAGYGIPACRQTIGMESFADPSNNPEYRVIAGSFGRGMHASLFGGYAFNKNFSVELGGDYLKGIDYVLKTRFPGFENTERYSVIMGRAYGGFRISYAKNRLHPYARMSALIGLFPKMIYSSSGVEYASNTLYNSETKTYSGGFSTGFHAGCGVLVNGGSRLSFFAELNFIYQVWAPQKSVISEKTEKSVDQFPTMTTYDKETEYVSDFIFMPNTTSNQPRKELKFYEPFSSWGLNIGLCYSFGRVPKS